MFSFNRINQLLNLSPREWPRVMIAWTLVFVSRIGFIVGGSLLLAIFLSRVGVELLPLLFLGSALLIMIGSALYRKLVHRVRGELLISFTVLFAAAFLVSSIFFLENNTTWFLILYLIGQSVLVSQLVILISLFNEELFTPLESQRTFPVVESAETVGGIVGGLSLTLFSDVLPAYKFILGWVVLLLLILPIVLKFNGRTMEVPKLRHHSEEKKTNGASFKVLKKYPFLKGLMVVVLLFWSVMNVLEFQYTKAVQADVLAGLDNGAIEELQHGITTRLGTLHIIFSAAAALMQLIFASRIITALGITSTMLLHPLVTLLNLIGMTLQFNFFTAALARGSHELTGILFKSTYDSSYYAIPHEIRRDAKEFMQGLMKPLGAILGTLSILFFAFRFEGESETLALNLVLLAMATVMAFMLSRMGKSYTQMVEQNLSHKLDLSTRLNAVEILGQRGHDKSIPSLQTILRRPTEPEILKERILNTLGLREDPDAVASILELLGSSNEELRLASVEALSHYDKLRSRRIDQSFTRHRVIESIKEAIEEEKNEFILERLIQVLHTIDPDRLTSFLLEELKKGEKIKPAFVRTLHLFPDPNLKFYLETILNSKNSTLRAAAVIALWQFKKMRGELRHHLSRMLESPKEGVLKDGIEAVGFIKEFSFKNELKKHLNNPSKTVRRAAVLALAEMEEEAVIPHVVEILMENTHRLRNVSKRFQKLIEQALEIHVIEKISTILSENRHLSLKEMSHETLKILKDLYLKIKAHHEVHLIEKILDSKVL